MLGLARFAKFTEKRGVIQAFYEGPEGTGIFNHWERDMNKFENGSGISLVLERCDLMIDTSEEKILLFETEKYNSE